MTDTDYKKYTNQARRGIKGEAFFETLIVEHAIPHRIARQNDLGIDFLCEWTYADRPCGILFSSQIKSTTTAEIKPQRVSPTNTKNGLETYKLTGAPKIDEATINYWKGLGLPAFLFYVVEDEKTGYLDCFYKRCTPFLDGQADEDYAVGSKHFYKANREGRFLGLAVDTEGKISSFARDLMVDCIRLSYHKGYIVQITPADLGLGPLSDDKKESGLRYYPRIVQMHRQKIEQTCEWITNLLKETPK